MRHTPNFERGSEIVTDAPVHAPLGARGDYGFSPSLVMVSDPSGGAAESLRALRTDIVARHIELGRRALAVCSPSRSTGCTFIAANLAVALAQIGLKTLLIDADLRNPSIHGMIRPAHLSGGLQTWLASPEAKFGEYIEPNVLPNLSVLYSGGSTPSPQEILATDRFRELMQDCMRDYDATIVDTPPANLCSDARLVSNIVGYSLIVARRNRTFVNDIKTLSDHLRSDHAQVIGTVLNEV